MLARQLLDSKGPHRSSGQLTFDDGTFRRDYNRRPFTVQHTLVGHPLFQFPALSALAERRLPHGDVLHWSGRIPVTADFDHAYRNHATGVSLENTLARIADAGSFVVINFPEHDPLYAPLLRALYNDIRVGSEPLDPGMTEIMAYVFISSPHSVTPYHMDREMNFLLQIQGTKLVHLWDARDRTIMTEQQVERLFGDPRAKRPGYKEEFAALVHEHHLKPGIGVHHPFIAPHWVKNGPEVSISLALTYRTRESQRITQAYQVNYAMRRLGLSPAPVGAFAPRDALKGNAYGALRDAKNWMVEVRQRAAPRSRRHQPQP
jgi:hypothetical protein